LPANNILETAKFSHFQKLHKKKNSEGGLQGVVDCKVNGLQGE